MINRAGNKEKAKRVLNENGNLSGMVGMEILYRVIAAITNLLCMDDPGSGSWISRRNVSSNSGYEPTG